VRSLRVSGLGLVVTGDAVLAAGPGILIEQDRNRITISAPPVAAPSVPDPLPGDPGGPVDWATLLNVPATFPPAAHTHPTGDVTGLDAALAGKADASAVALKADAAALALKADTSALALKADASAVAGKADQTTVTAALALKADTSSVSSALSVKADSSALTAKADLASPSFTGSPTAPTQTGGDNSTKVATTAYARQAAPNGSYRTILDCSGSHTAARVAGLYALSQGQPLAISGTGTLYPLNTIYLAAADYPTVDGLVAKLRIRAQLYTNDVAPTGNYTFGLYPITRPATSGGAGVGIYTLGTVVPGSTGLRSPRQQRTAS
jgi:hypothetical protein